MQSFEATECECEFCNCEELSSGWCDDCGGTGHITVCDYCLNNTLLESIKNTNTTYHDD